jgi:hypothetical protein
MAIMKLKQRRRRPRHGPYSKPSALTNIDGRCRIARTVKEFAQELARHVGGDPTPAQRVLIREASVKNAKLSMLVDQILEGGADPDLATRSYLAWSNSLRRDLEALGLKAPEQKQRELAEFLAVRRPGRPPKVAA